MKKNIILTATVFLSIFFLFQRSAFAVDNISSCLDEKCIKEYVNKAANISNPESFCKGLNGKYHSFFEDDSLEEICHLYVATKKAFARDRLKCIDNFDLDLSSKTKLISKFYHDAVLDQLPASIKPSIDCNKNACGGNLGSTIYDSYNFSTGSSFEKYGNQVPVRFKTYFCITEESFKRYIPYFYALYIGEGIGKKTYFGYLDKIPFEKDPIIKQLLFYGDLKVEDDFYKIIDFNKDGFKDLVFLESVGLKNTFGTCLYKKGADKCTLVKSAEVAFDFMPELEMKVAANTVNITDIKNSKKYSFIYSRGKIQVKEGKPEIKKDVQKYQSEVTTYGIYKKVEDGDSYTYELSEKSDIITAKKGLLFGFNYTLKGIKGDAQPVTVRVYHPSMKNPSKLASVKESSWQDNAYPSPYKNFAGWTFGEKWEMVKGDWKIQVLVDNEIQVQKEFVIK